ncbi:MAG: hypothetical protein UY47_C0004G0002 [Parcubacteria group bacterium GW2011_GWB1_49_7]|uniref:Lycopene cyclase domain-containing protein n=1 Tax=Candidatus Zambryskibacteria bacterium RIFCSPHIGHO2_01_FULL_46_25 TaxID=1802738 RepID=A0A1G2SZZ2_9BACT|nr:MAG: hypothetical protein UX71_C0002G0110 [Parcubacteria group bacterium GW2011_GWA1_47_10]KKW09828.1 MAG: hypothetical protein UY47_C0004G0002 [Parcubacteria group bacterium GW2011_GWB1_49_7]OHA90607.1 MAG: hypothetical protein A2838_02710 [Candidatus Zambryskibacteria bacterium RIFCSPHIGHO2_01_FULL_46_25]OHB01802.1 MAG: hypothetical protein A3F53_00665 [Candidatus Zambryskibacteria bacterium RIFCSPHIGHO2_12_FULL_48_10]OHB07250.1 MAG: hypothetical protein A3A31_01850 [Candidatus Zambryskiba
MDSLLGYEYLVGGIILAVIWLTFIFIRRDLLKVMLWSSFGYFGLFIVGLIILPILNNFIPADRAFNPGYWNPNSLWDLNKITGGAGLEDGFFMFFVGGIAAAAYEIFFRQKVREPKKHGYRLHALKVGIIAAAVFGLIIKINLIWPLIIFGFVTALAEVKERHDLWAHAVWGGIVFFVIYLVAFEAFNLIYPLFISNTYNLSNLSGLLFLGFPIEELLYALSFGMMWAPIYEYVTGARDTKIPLN